jgi:hypothetical protein
MTFVKAASVVSGGSARAETYSASSASVAVVPVRRIASP